LGVDLIFDLMALDSSSRRTVLEVDLASAQRFPSNLIGVNCNILNQPFPYDSDEFRKLYEDAGRPFFRYPGGTVANYLNHGTGFLDANRAGNRRAGYERKNERVTRMTGGAGYVPEKFIEVVRGMELPFSLVLNMCTMSIDENESFLRKFAASGIQITHIELANEVFFAEYSTFFHDASEYLRQARELSRVCRSLFPHVKIGVVIPNTLYRNKSFPDRADKPGGDDDRQIRWIRQLARHPGFYDAVIVHCYSTIGVENSKSAADLPSVEQVSYRLLSQREGNYLPFFLFRL